MELVVLILDFLAMLAGFVFQILGYVFQAIMFIIEEVPVIKIIIGIISFYTLGAWLLILAPRADNPSFGQFIASLFSAFAIYHVAYPYAPNYVIGGAISEMAL